MRTAPTLLGAAVLASVAAGCGGAPAVPERPPDVTGVVAGTADAGGPVLTEPSDDYFEGMSLLRGDPVLVGDDGVVVPVEDLADGDRIEVWVGPACAESFPVQCDVVALRVLG